MSHLQKYAENVSRWIKAVIDSEPGRAAVSDPAIYDLANNVKELAFKLESGRPTEEQILELQRRSEMLSIRLHAVENNNAISGWRTVSVPAGQHKLPPLPYAYNALEPVISEEIMRLHHDKHHKTYVDGLNRAETMMKKSRDTNDFSLIKYWEKEAAFHGSGHYLHTIFWEIMNPKGGGKPTGALLRQIEKDFGTFEAFKKHFSEAAKQVEGVGWALLVWSSRSRKLEILQSEFHMNLTQWDTIPLLVLDVWEHAYYLQYKNNRSDYVENWWRVVYWPKVEDRFARSKQVQWIPY